MSKVAMDGRLGAKIGWICGWAGAFLWVLILSIIWLVQGKTLEGVSGLALVCLAGLLVYATLPWRHAKTPFWKLMLPAYGALVLSVPWAVWSFGPQESGLSWWSLAWVLPLLVPFGVIGRRRWNDFEPQQADAAGPDKG
ncbi:MAG: hypothetical protein QUS33_12795 [Dehalococcoidia bacterium]|nr:hypothetical protein [Dehalococcoidia bacterium]